MKGFQDEHIEGAKNKKDRIKMTEIAKPNTSSTEQLGTATVGRLLLKLAASAIVAQIINLLYNMVDRIYIGHIEEVGQMALTGVGVCLPLITLIFAFAALAGMGAAPRASIFLGKGDKGGIRRITTNTKRSENK